MPNTTSMVNNGVMLKPTKMLAALVDSKADKVAEIRSEDSISATSAVVAVVSAVSFRISLVVEAGVVHQDSIRAGHTDNSIRDRWKLMSALTSTQLC